MLLLSIIRANPPASEENNLTQRLRDTKLALSGIKPKGGRPVDGDLPELLRMAQMYIRDRGDFAFDLSEDGVWQPCWPPEAQVNARSVTELARLALDERRRLDPTAWIQDFEGKVRLLQKKFEKQRQGLLATAAGWPGIENALYQDHVAEVAELIKLLGYAVECGHQPLRDAEQLT